MTARLLYIDIETTPLATRNWTAYESNALEILEDSHLLGFAYAWDDGPVKAVYPSLDGSGVYGYNERELTDEVWRLLDEADIIVAHNGDRFDVRRIRERILLLGYRPPAPYRTIDTLKIVRKEFGFPKNNLDYIAERLGYGKKIETNYSLWKRCMDSRGDDQRRAFREMKRYNLRDVDLLRKVYLHLRPWHSTHPHVGDYDGCPVCNSTSRTSRGYATTNAGLKYPRYQCICGKYYRGRTAVSSTLTRN